jgi:hypothetical protein
MGAEEWFAPLQKKIKPRPPPSAVGDATRLICMRTIMEGQLNPKSNGGACHQKSSKAAERVVLSLHGSTEACAHVLTEARAVMSPPLTELLHLSGSQILIAERHGYECTLSDVAPKERFCPARKSLATQTTAQFFDAQTRTTQRVFGA